MVQINDDYYEDLTAENFDKLLDDLAAGRPVQRGSQTGRAHLRAGGRPDVAHDLVWRRRDDRTGFGTTLNDDEAVLHRGRSRPGARRVLARGGPRLPERHAECRDASARAAGTSRAVEEPQEDMGHGGLDGQRKVATARPEGSVAGTGTRTDDPVGVNQVESSAVHKSDPVSDSDRQGQPPAPPADADRGRTGPGSTAAGPAASAAFRNVFYNSSLQLAEVVASCPAIEDLSTRCLFLPDYFNYLLSGRMENELSIASTSQLIDVQTNDWSRVALDYFHLPAQWFTPPVLAGTKLGRVRGVAGLEKTQVIAVPGHDTACAYDAMPASPEGTDLYISSGTWSLVGFESDQPVLGKDALAARISMCSRVLASGWVAAASAFALFLGVHALESYILTPIIQRQALDIPPATLFAFQILLGVVFGIWGIALALPLMAIVKVMIDHFKAGDR